MWCNCTNIIRGYSTVINKCYSFFRQLSHCLLILAHAWRKQGFCFSFLCLTVNYSSIQCYKSCIRSKWNGTGNHYSSHDSYNHSIGLKFQRNYHLMIYEWFDMSKGVITSWEIRRRLILYLHSMPGNRFSCLYIGVCSWFLGIVWWNQLEDPSHWKLCYL